MNKLLEVFSKDIYLELADLSITIFLEKGNIKN
jgi:hypothetical protein